MQALPSSALTELEATLKAARASHLERVQSCLAGRDADETRTLVNHFSNGDSRAAAALLADTDVALLQHDVAELDAISAALKRIEQGVGGLCVVCRDPIPLARLQALPTAATCLHCQDEIDAAKHSHR